MEERKKRIEEITSDLRAAQKGILGLGDMSPELAPLVAILRSILRNTDFLLDELSRREQEHQEELEQLRVQLALSGEPLPTVQTASSSDGREIVLSGSHPAEEIRKARREAFDEGVDEAQAMLDVDCYAEEAKTRNPYAA